MYGSYRGTLTLYVVEGAGPPLLGQDWLKHIRLDWSAIRQVVVSSPLRRVNQLVSKYSEVFRDGLGTMKHLKSSLVP